MLAALFGGIAVAFAVRFLPLAFAADQRHHLMFWPDVVFTACFSGLLIWLAAYYVWSVRRARERVQWRERVLSGADGVPPKSPASAAPTEPTPLAVTLIWRQPWWYRVIGAASLLCSLMCAFVAGLLGFKVVVALIQNNTAFFNAFANLGASFGVLAVTLIAAFVAYYFWNGASEPWRRAVKLIVSDDGITRCVGRQKQLIRWDDMCLLEVVSSWEYKANRMWRKERFLLYSRAAVIAWDDVYSSRAMFRQHKELLAIIERRTQLSPRKSLEPARGLYESAD